MAMHIYLDGTRVDDRVDGLDDISLTIKRKNGKGELRKSFSTELVFYGKAYSYLKNALIGPTSGVLSRVEVIVMDDCCSGSVFEGVIRADAVDWCEDECWMKASVIQDDEETERLTCIQSTLVSDNSPNGAFPSGFRNSAHPFMRYCLDLRPDVLQYFVLYGGIILNVIFYTLVPLVAVISLLISVVAILCNVVNAMITVINAIITVVNTLPGVGIALIHPLNCPTVNPLDDIANYLAWVDAFNDKITGCGRAHPSPFARDYIRNVCSKCGLTFQSNILNNPLSPYYNSVYFNAPVKKGYSPSQSYPSVSFIADNAPIHTLDTFLDEMGEVFNAEYEVRGNVLIFERKDYFQPASVWIDTVTKDEDVIQGVCFKYKDRPLPAFWDGRLSVDGVDMVGNEGSDRFSDIVEWNAPPSPSQSGSEEAVLPVAPVRARLDGIDTDLYDMLAALPNISPWTWLPVIASINTYDRAIIIPQHTAFTPKLVVWDGQSYVNGYVKRDYQTVRSGYPGWGTIATVPASTAGGALPPVGKRVNYPYFIHEGAPGALYDEFWSINNPRNPSSTIKQFDLTCTVRLNCSLLRTFDFQKGLGVNFRGQYRIATINELKVNYKDMTIDISAEL